MLCTAFWEITFKGQHLEVLTHSLISQTVTVQESSLLAMTLSKNICDYFPTLCLSPHHIPGFYRKHFGGTIWSTAASHWYLHMAINGPYWIGHRRTGRGSWEDNQMISEQVLWKKGEYVHWISAFWRRMRRIKREVKKIISDREEVYGEWLFIDSSNIRFGRHVLKKMSGMFS